ncbi:MAG TPA: hypothetical protein VFV99_24945, partial [Kofleriaceae bacterium]|nr:hypothetical protein [Kofleriaceae bacterium]
MRRSRARLLAAAVVVSTAGAASASLDLVVHGDPSPYGARAVVVLGAIGGDGGTIDDTPLAGSDGPSDGFDAPMEGGFDAPMEGGLDGPVGSDGGGIPDAPPITTIDIMEPTIAITGPQGVLSQATATVITMDTGQLGSAAIFSTDSSMKLSYCGLTTCNWSPPEVLPYSLTVECVPGPMQTIATLQVFEASNGSPAMANVTCTSTSSNPVLNVTPDSLDFSDVPVGQTPSQMIYVENTGFGTLNNVVIDFGATTNANQWSASACTAASPCSFGAGSGSFVSITFAPTTHGAKNVLATVTSANGGTDTVSLTGTGTGGVMSVQTPTGNPPVLDIGTIPKGQAFSRDIVLANSGNAMYTATTST